MKNNDSAILELFGLSKNCRYIYIPEMNINTTVKKENGVTIIKEVNQKFKNLLVDQNNAWLTEFCYGSLLDNELFECKKGYMAFYETFCNEWSSSYTVYFSRDYKVMEKFYNDFDEELNDSEEAYIKMNEEL